MADKLRVRRANVILEINPDSKDYYLGQGFDVIDNRGKVVEETTTLSPEALKIKVAELEEIIKKKDAEIARLKKSTSTAMKTKDE